jgi:hypothetical protein
MQTNSLLEVIRSWRAKAYKPQNPSIGYALARYVARPMALGLSPFLAAWGVHPHLITIAATITGLAAGLLLIKHQLFWGAVGLLLWYFLDHVDGQVARLQGRASLAGVYLDFWMHSLIHSVTFTALAVMGWQQEASTDGSAFLEHWAPAGFLVGMLALESHAPSLAKTLIKEPAFWAESRSPFVQDRIPPQKHLQLRALLYRICEFPNILLQLLVLGWLQYRWPSHFACCYHWWLACLGVTALVGALARVSQTAMVTLQRHVSADGLSARKSFPLQHPTNSGGKEG